MNKLCLVKLNKVAVFCHFKHYVHIWITIVFVVKCLVLPHCVVVEWHTLNVSDGQWTALQRNHLPDHEQLAKEFYDRKPRTDEMKLLSFFFDPEKER